jgi:hypothetical protein
MFLKFHTSMQLFSPRAPHSSLQLLFSFSFHAVAVSAPNTATRVGPPSAPSSPSTVSLERCQPPPTLAPPDPEVPPCPTPSSPSLIATGPPHTALSPTVEEAAASNPPPCSRMTSAPYSRMPPPLAPHLAKVSSLKSTNLS